MYYEITNLLTRGLDLAGGQSIWRETWVIMTDADATVDKYHTYQLAATVGFL